jgi:acid phosphatase (class A)
MMKKSLKRLVILPLLLTLAACAGGDKYPFPPQFLDVSDISMRTLPPPPAQYSATYTREIDSILAAQAALTPAQKQQIAAEDHISPAMMLDPVLGAGYGEETHPQLYMLLRHAATDAWRIGDATQEHWMRMRPWLADSRVEILVKRITRPSYPSGHATTNHIWAHVLSDLFPKHHEALFARAQAIGQHRVDGGVHFPSDVLAGKKLAAAIYKKMRLVPAFQRELAAARSEIKTTRVAANDNAPLRQAPIAQCTYAHSSHAMTACK